ncbi:ATP-binding cassette domain-containing protein [Loigolactobacillus binensis]|uniref:ATP-binding cassette domain-containing protein n=1 Tax=Loigolactobacillus binensis TaxID=2559922 RepID=A0ABW3E9P7_9LACO|nr:ATP-binding cassette domain-containing protein [Loigolactobacillus binensis]
MKLTVEHAGFGYKKSLPVIKDLNFKAESGNLIAILGPNGAGKTTLLRCTTGLLKWNQGQSFLDGQNTNEMPGKDIWQKVAYVPQAHGSFAALTVEDMILLGATSRVGVFSTPGQKEKEFVLQLMAELGIERLLHKNCNEISGGELQMVLIARALAGKPELLILDEPESNLDFKNQLIVLNTMTRLVAEGICVIFNTHYPDHALSRASQSLILQKGGHSIFGETSKIVTEENIRKAFGVKAVIGQTETDGHIYQSVVPLEVIKATGECEPVADAPIQKLALISCIISDPAAKVKVLALCQQYADFIIEHTEKPLQQGQVTTATITMEAPAAEISALTHEIGILPGIDVKTTICEKQALAQQATS